MEKRERGRPTATTHDAIRQTAMQLFATEGYAATSLARIAQVVGISRTTLFSYFPAKRDLIWEELDQAVAALPEHFVRTDDEPIIDMIVDAVVSLSRSDATSRAEFTERWRIVQADAELRAYTGAQAHELSLLIVDAVLRRAPGCDPVLTDHVTHAVMAVAARCTDEWSRDASILVDLQSYTRSQLQPIAAALGALLAA